MKNSIFSFMIFMTIIACQQKPDQPEVLYLNTAEVDSVDSYFGQEIKDPYRWLENDRSEQTEAWVKDQNKITFGYLEQIPFREAFKTRMKELWNYEKITAPRKEGEWTYYSKNDGLQNQYVVYRQKDNSDPEIFLDPNKFSGDGSTSLGSLEFSEDSRMAAYSISEAGSDWRKIIVIDADTKQIMEDTLRDVKFSGISWKGNEGFFYSSYDKPKGSELSAKTDQHKLFFHQLGTPQSQDKLIFGGVETEKHRYVQGYVTEDGRYLVVLASESTSGNKLLIKDLNEKNAKFSTILDHYESDTYVLHNVGSKLFLITNLNAPNQRLVTVDISNPGSENWIDLIPETENVLDVSAGGGYLFANYMIDAVSKVFQYDLEGNLIQEITLPGVGSANGFQGKVEDKVLYYSFTNYKTPTSIYKYTPSERETELFWKPKLDFDPDQYVSEQLFYASKDGTRIPIIITHKKGIKKDGKNPTMLYGYGGFNVSLTPSFSIVNALWMEQGGVYAVPNIRGGGEYGKKWHDAGTKLQKQNVFDDFIAAAEFLIQEGYTSSDYLAVRGGSNGGLLVGATMTQRPDLMKVALPAVGVLDMLRYHTFTAGAGWAYDYGTSEESEEMFRYLLGYSPLHNISPNTKYPATLITTGDHDDRVVPAHSFKFAAELQKKQAGDNPILIRIETNAGHGAGKPTSKIIEEYSDILSFTLYNMGYRILPYQTQSQLKG